MSRAAAANSPASHVTDQEWENVDFLMSEDGGSLTLEQAAGRLGTDFVALKKRWDGRARRQRKAAG